MAVFSGARGTGNVASEQLRIDMAQRVLELQPSATPLLVFTKRASKQATHNPKFQWFEDDLLPTFDRINDATPPDAAATTWTVDTGTNFAKDDLVRVTRTGEVARVTAVATNDLTVVRAVGSTAAALLDDDELLIIGSAAEQGADDKAARSQNPTVVFNYTQIERTPVDMTETLRHTDTEHTPHDWDRQRNKRGIEHVRAIEQALVFGTRSQNTSGTHPRNTTGGFYYYATKNETDAGGTLTETEFFSALRPIFEFAENERLAMASGLAIDVLNGFARGKLELVQADTDKTYGLSIFRYVSPHGVLNLVKHPLLKGDEYAGHIAIVDLTQTVYRYLANKEGSRDTHVNEHIEDRGTDGRKDEYLTEFGLQFGLPDRHGFISGITG